jgi:hypothetical protein
MYKNATKCNKTIGKCVKKAWSIKNYRYIGDVSAGTLELPLMLLSEFLGLYFLARRPIGRTSRGFSRCFAFLSTLDSHTLNHVDDAFCLCMMRRYVLCEQHRLLQWLSPFFSVFQSSPLLIASPVALGRNGTPRACFGWSLLVLACRAPRLY